MPSYSLSYNLLVQGVVTIDWPAEVSHDILLDLLSFRDNILNKSIKGINEVVNGYHSLWIYTDQSIDLEALVSELKEIYKDNSSQDHNSKLWTIPVCYDPYFARDMIHVQTISGLTASEIISRHSQVNYRVFIIGFMPGFLYLGGLDRSLHIPRKENPDQKIDAGSVAIGGSQTGIYPMDSPGGWHVIGKSPISIFNPSSPPYCKVSPGDQVRFKAIGIDDYRDLYTSVQNDNYTLIHE